jgi:hypothetical protein
MLSISVVIPIGPGHYELAAKALRSAQYAWAMSHGPFGEINYATMLDLDGKRGRSNNRNRGMDCFPADWYFFLDAGDEMMPNAFDLVDLDAPATFGAVCIEGEIAKGNKHPVTRDILFEHGMRGTLNMGCFVNARLGLRFDEALRVGEDFDFYLRLPGFTKLAEPLVSIGRYLPSEGGPSCAGGKEWREACEAVIEHYRPNVYEKL